MRSATPVSPGLWIVTDVEGRIAQVSPVLRALLGIDAGGRGRNLLLFFPNHRRNLAFDMEVARTGWPTVRTAVLSPPAKRPCAVQYRVNCFRQDEGVRLHWSFSLVGHAGAVAS